MADSFKKFVLIKEGAEDEASSGGASKDWKKQYTQLEKGFIPPPNMRPIIQAFLDSGNIEIQADLTKPMKMPKKSLFLVGGPVRDFLKGKTPKDLDLATNATPEQVAHILHNAGFKTKGKRNELSGQKEPAYDVSGAKGAPMKLAFDAEVGRPGDNLYWYLKVLNIR